MISANQAAPIDQGEGESEALGGMLYGGMLSMVIFYGDILKLPSLFTFLSYHVLQCVVYKNVTLGEKSRSELMLF